MSNVHRHAILIDFGSTFTKVTAVDLERAVVVGRAEAPTTVTSGVHHGLASALTRLAATCGAIGKDGAGLDLLEGAHVRASSSAAGGLRIAVVGNVPGMTVEAGNAAALGAGAKVVGAFGFKLDGGDVSALAALRPDLVLLAGGTEGGDTATILHNARQLSASRVAVPILVAGNSAARAEARSALEHGGKAVSIADNVMPRAGEIVPQSARKEIRRLFIARITAAKGFEALASVVPIVQATPDAVLRGAALASRGTNGASGWGDLVLVDIGGATTDVHSIGDGAQIAVDVVPQGIAESFEKRTVEGDLGIRVNATTIVARAGEAKAIATFRAMFPRSSVPDAKLLDYVQRISEETERTPGEDWELAMDAVLGRLAADIAIERHVGRREPYYAREGVVWLQSGKNLTEAKVLIGTGGIFAHNPFAPRILECDVQDGSPRVLRPIAPRLLRDEHYIMHVAGLLVEDHPRVALRLLETHLSGGAPYDMRPALMCGHTHHDHDCCA